MYGSTWGPFQSRHFCFLLHQSVHWSLFYTKHSKSWNIEKSGNPCGKVNGRMINVIIATHQFSSFICIKNYAKKKNNWQKKHILTCQHAKPFAGQNLKQVRDEWHFEFLPLNKIKKNWRGQDCNHWSPNAQPPEMFIRPLGSPKIIYFIKFESLFLGF